MVRIVIGATIVVAIVATVLSLTTLGASLRFRMGGGTQAAAVIPTPLPSPSPSPLTSPTAKPTITPRSFTAFSTDLTRIASSAGVHISLTLIELAGNQPDSWSIQGDLKWTAASTYKLPLLMAQAQGIANGTLHGSDKLCYQSSDYEPGPYGDYSPGKCFTRDVLAQRVGHSSDNTAAHILVRYLGGTAALNAFARSMGAIESQFFIPNTTTSSDLARLWASEARGAAGGAAAQSWLYPLLTKTVYEAGIPAGTPSAPVVHKIGTLGKNLHDAALVVNGPRGGYVLVICSDGAGGWKVLAQLAQRVWQFEAARSIPWPFIRSGPTP